MNWTFKSGKGSAHLLVDSNGSYQFSGNYEPESKGKYLEAVIVVFEKGSPNLSAAAMLFQHRVGRERQMEPQGREFRYWVRLPDLPEGPFLARGLSWAGK